MPYDPNVTYRGNWSVELDGAELYDYNTDLHETTNHAADASYAAQVQKLEAALRQQFDAQQPQHQ